MKKEKGNKVWIVVIIFVALFAGIVIVNYITGINGDYKAKQLNESIESHEFCYGHDRKIEIINKIEMCNIVVKEEDGKTVYWITEDNSLTLVEKYNANGLLIKKGRIEEDQKKICEEWVDSEDIVMLAGCKNK